LGSDHTFGMSLCCGGMSDGSGQGAIAEVAVFSGRLPHEDITAMEHHLMRKHDIVQEQQQQQHPSSKNSRNDDKSKWDREAHALLQVDDPAVHQNGSGFEGHVPLRYLARHRNVAWSQTDPITGKTLPIKRIGCRMEGDSSDF
jgi:hypothetical protein